MQLTPELVTAAAGLVAAIGSAIKQVFDVRRERRARRRDVDRVARAAGPHVVKALADERDKAG